MFKTPYRTKLDEHLHGTVLRTSNNGLEHTQQLLNATLGLAGESGEVVDLIKKFVFHGHPFEITKLKNEIGDCMYYLQWICSLHNLTIEECLEANIAKLNKRYPDGFSVEASINRVDKT